MQAPTILRLPTDDFMGEVARVLAADPGAAEGLRGPARSASAAARPARPPRGRRAGAAQALPAGARRLLPRHGERSSAAVPGLPEHLVRPEVRERVGFVLRRVEGGSEQAWAGKAWQPLAAGDVGVVADGEDVLPMFPLNFADGGRTRRLFVGLVPTSSGEARRNAGSRRARPVGRRPRRRPGRAARHARPEGDRAAEGAPGGSRSGPTRPPTTTGRRSSRRRAPRRSRRRASCCSTLPSSSGQVPQTWQLVAGRRAAAARRAAPARAPARASPRRRGSPGPRRCGSPGCSASASSASRTGALARADLADGDTDPKERRLDLPRAAGRPRPGAGATVDARARLGERPEARPRRAHALPHPLRLTGAAACPLHDDSLERADAPFAVARFFDPDAAGRPIQISLPIDPGGPARPPPRTSRPPLGRVRSAGQPRHRHEPR